MSAPDAVHRFLLESLDIRGAIVHLGPAWREMQAGRGYPAAVRDLLGELATVTTVIGNSLKVPGRLSFQLKGHGAVSMLVVDCREHEGTLRLRGMARVDEAAGGAVPPGLTSSPSAGRHESPPGPASGVRDLLGDGQLVLTLQPDEGNPYQSVVPLEGDTLAAVFEHFLAQSEQQPAQLHLAADAESACALFLQKLPGADARDADGWDRVRQLAATVRGEELRLPPGELLTRLFPEEDVRLFRPRPVAWHCPRDEEKVRNMLYSLGREELVRMLEEAGQIAVEDEICNQQYRFAPDIIDELFPPAGRVLH